MKKSIKAGSHKKLFGELVTIMTRLRGAQGCPWDKHQTHETLLKYLFSEAREVKQAVKNKDPENLKEELGDILLQVVFHAQIAQENGNFCIADVVDEINRKLVRRHPHVFSGETLKTPNDVLRRWKEIKLQEKLSKKKSSTRVK